jgi:hypothetical protein
MKISRFIFTAALLVNLGTWDSALAGEEARLLEQYNHARQIYYALSVRIHRYRGVVSPRLISRRSSAHTAMKGAVLALRGLKREENGCEMVIVRFPEGDTDGTEKWPWSQYELEEMGAVAVD